MKRSRLLVVCALLVATLCSCAKKQFTPESLAEDERQIRQMEIEASRAISTKNAESLAALYAENAALYDDRGPAVSGKDAIRKTWEADFARPELSMSTEPQAIEISRNGDLAWARGIYKVRIDSTKRPAEEDQWEYAWTYLRQPNGNWRIMADSTHSLLRTHLLKKPAKSASPYAPFAPLLGLGCFLGGIWFMVGMPVIAVIQGWKSYRGRRITAGFFLSAIMFVVFLLAALLLWKHISTYYWNLPLSSLFAATTDSLRYGNPVEDTSEDLVVMLLVVSTFSAAAAGLIAGGARWAWLRHSRHALA